MASFSLFQKYRSQNFDDLIGQEVVVKTLKNALASKRTANVYLFCGPRGTGKTSTARILAKALNCADGPTASPCGICSACRSISEGSCLDVLEIDAASNTQVDKIRDLIVDKVQFAPAQVRYKVYIIDEVHKLSDSSFNALLKTLEEPPAHVIFILATTDPEKIPATIISRCQRYNFQRFTLIQTVNHIKNIALREQFFIDDLGAELIARASEGSMRDALVLLEQAMFFCGHQGTSAQISSEDIRRLLGLAGAEAIQDFISGFIEQNIGHVLTILDDLINKGRDLNKLATELLEYMRQMMLVSVNAADRESLGVTDSYFQELVSRTQLVKLGTIMNWIGAVSELQRRLSDGESARLIWETTLIKLTVPAAKSSDDGLLARIEALEADIASLKILSSTAHGFSKVIPSDFQTSSVREKTKLGSSGANSSASVKTHAPLKDEVSTSVASEKVSDKVISAAAEGKETCGSSEIDLGWDSEPNVAPSSALNEKKGVISGKSASDIKLREQNQVKVKTNSAEAVWGKLLGYIENKRPDLFAFLHDTRCLSAVKGVIVVRYENSRKNDYESVLNQREDIETVLSEAMRRPIKLEARLRAIASPEDEYMHTVNLILNSFDGRVVSTYKNNNQI
ncbi:MAG: DNA polymerase III subunit gamma/tau [Candidatus Bruticola sp.]